MDDRIFFIAVTYLVIASLVSGFLPSSLYTGTRFSIDSVQSFQDEFNETGLEVTELDGQISFISKVATFMFVTWRINDIPPIVAGIIFLLNLFVIFISAIWSYDKIRGI